MSRVFFFIACVFCSVGTCLAGQLEVDFASGDVQSGRTLVNVTFTGKIPDSLKAAVADPRTYEVRSNAPASTRSARATVSESEIPVEQAVISANGEEVWVYLSAKFYGSATIKVSSHKTGIDELKGRTLPFSISQPYNLSRTVNSLDLGANADATTVNFEISHAGNFRYAPGQPVIRDFYSLEGTVPINIPIDAKAAGVTRRDTSGKVADYLMAQFRRQVYDGNRYAQFGLRARGTAELRGGEGVAFYETAAFLDQRGGAFAGLSGELGIRDGNAEWKSVTVRAPDRGSMVARLGFVAEFAPDLGAVNRDLGAGLRFFVRCRGWFDYAKNVDGTSAGVRFRPFVDSELFYNFSDTSRVFLRYEKGSLPPDLSQDTSRLFFGLGAAF